MYCIVQNIAICYGYLFDIVGLLPFQIFEGFPILNWRFIDWRRSISFLWIFLIDVIRRRNRVLHLDYCCNRFIDKDLFLLIPCIGNSEDALTGICIRIRFIWADCLICNAKRIRLGIPDVILCRSIFRKCRFYNRIFTLGTSVKSSTPFAPVVPVWITVSPSRIWKVAPTIGVS